MDNISIEVLLDTFEIIGDIFLNIINESLRTGVVPDVFKVSMVVPIPKINNTNKCEEFRPIKICFRWVKNVLNYYSERSVNGLLGH